MYTQIITIILLTTTLYTQTQTIHNTTQFKAHKHTPQHLNIKSSTHTHHHNLPSITYIGNTSHITHLHLSTPKLKPTKYYTWNSSKIIFLGGDIQPNPSPLSNITKNLPQEYQQRFKQYSTPTKEIAHLVNSNHTRHLQWSLWITCCIIIFLYNKELALSLYILATYIGTYTTPATNRYTHIITIIHNQTQTIHNTTQTKTHTHITQHFTIKSPTYPHYHNHTNTTHTNTQPTTLRNSLTPNDYNEEEISRHLKKNIGYWSVQINANKFATSQILKKPVEVVKGQILVG
jgi:hypothetical protein